MARAPDAGHAVGLEHAQELVDPVGRVDDHRLAGHPVPHQVDEVDHLAGHLVVDGEVPAGQQLAEVQAVGVGSRRGRGRWHRSRPPLYGRPVRATRPLRPGPPEGPAAVGSTIGTRRSRTGDKGWSVTTEQSRTGPRARTPPRCRRASGMIRQWARETPDAPMLTEGSTTLSWGEVYDRARRVAYALGRAGVGPGDRVAFLDRNGSEYFEVLFGCALLGAVSVAVNWRLAPAEIAAIVEDAGTPILFYGPDYAAAVKEVETLVDGVDHWVALEQLRRVAGRRRGRRAGRPGLRARPRRRRGPALHLGDHRAAQGGGHLGPQHLGHPHRGRPGLPHRRGHRVAWWPCRSSTSAGPAGPCAGCPGAATRSS